ncbi:MAG: carotenoid oxygenase family protein [Candidatus Binatia bacterium]|nr:carotenoid oxygenase family protein [Candidatus Binatia bacterium]
MKKNYSRREALHYAGAGAAALAGSGLLAACSDVDAPFDASGAERPGVVDPEIPVGDPATWWLNGNYAPVDAERDVLDLKVVGSIPPELNGVYMRNGPNPVTGESAHWFFGHGMLHGVRIRDGAAEWYRNRYIQTELLTDPPQGGLGPPSRTAHQANTAIAVHDGRVLAVAETGLPYEIDRELGTRGWYDYDGKLTTAMTAHPKVDPRTGEMLFFGYGFSDFLTYHQVNAAGVLVRSEKIDLPAFSMMHDFAVSENHVVFIDVPIGFDFDLLTSGFPLAWDDEHPSRLGVMPRNGGNADVVWVEIDQCMIVHTMNAHDTEDGKVVLEVARMPELWRGGPSNWQTGNLWRYTIDPAAGTVREEQLDEQICDFPQFDRSLLGRKNRYGYAAHFGVDTPEGVLRGVNGLIKYDLERGSSQRLDLPAGHASDEVYFVPAADGSAEDHGYLVGFGHDARSNRSHLAIYDAEAMEKVATVEIPVRVPAGFHGMWIDEP